MLAVIVQRYIAGTMLNSSRVGTFLPKFKTEAAETDFCQFLPLSDDLFLY